MAKQEKQGKGVGAAIADAVQGIWFRRPWNTERKSTFPAHLRSAEGVLKTPQLAITSDVTEAVRRTLIACGAPEDVSVSVSSFEGSNQAAEALLDTFNGQFALDVQAAADAAVAGVKDKESGEYTTAPVTDAEEVQAVMDAFRATPNQRRMGEAGGGVKEAAKVGRKVKEVAAQASAEDLAVLKRLGLA